MKNVNWNEVQTSGTRLAPGGYVCGITTIEDVEDKEYLKFEFDIAEGEFKNYYRALKDSKGFWGGSFIKSYKDTALGFFKQMLTCFEKSNNGFKFNNNPQEFKRKYIGLVLGEEEYCKSDGTINKRLYVDSFKSVDEIRKGEFTVPPFKTLDGTPAKPTDTSDIDVIEDDDDDLPFA